MPFLHTPSLLSILTACGVALALAGCGALYAARAGVPPTVEHDPTLPQVRLLGYPFHAEHHGAPGLPVLIVLHGGPGADYRYLLGLKELADSYQVVFYDQRGTGLSPRVPAADITVRTFVEDLDAFVDTFGQGRKVHLLGHSWGAMLASAYTGAHPHKVQSLVMAEPAFLDASTSDIFTTGAGPSWQQIVGLGSAWLGKWWVPTGGDPYAREDWFLLQALPLMQHPTELCGGRLPPLQAWRFGSPNFEATIGRMMKDPEFARQLDFRQGTDKFEGAALFLVGACNQLDGATQQRRHLHHYRQASLVEIPEAGHFMFNDQPARSVAVVREFLAAHTAQ